MTTKIRYENRHAGQAMRLIAAKKGLRIREVASAAQLDSYIINATFAGNGTYRDETLDKIAHVLGLKNYHEAIAIGHDIEGRTLKDQEHFPEIFKLYWESDKIAPEIRRKIKQPAKTILLPNRKNELHDSVILHTLYHLGLDSITEIEKIIGYKPPSEKQAEKPPCLAPSDFVAFRHAVRFIMQYKNWDHNDLLPEIASRDFKAFIEVKAENASFGDIQQENYRKLCRVLNSSADPKQLIALVEKVGDAQYPYYKEFPLLLKAYRAQQFPAARARTDKIAQTHRLPAETRADIERREKIMLGRLLSNTHASDDASIQYIDDIEAGKKPITPWSVGTWLSRLFANQTIPMEFFNVNTATGVDPLMQKLIRDSGLSDQYPLPQERSPLLNDPRNLPEDGDKGRRKRIKTTSVVTTSQVQI